MRAAQPGSSHDLVDDQVRYAQQHEDSSYSVPGIVQPASPDRRVTQEPLPIVLVRVRTHRSACELGEDVGPAGVPRDARA